MFVGERGQEPEEVQDQATKQPHTYVHKHFVLH